MRTLERDETAVRPAVGPPWEPPPAEPCPGADETHVWLARVDIEPPQLESLRAVLSDDERCQASRFAFETHQRRYVVAHGILRNILGRYLGLRGAELRFLKEDPYGKPGLADGCGDARLRFNVSHSDAIAVFAVTRDREVGVDIERIRPAAETLSFSTHSVSPKAVLAMARDMFDATPKAYELGIRGYEFNEFGERLSDNARSNLDAAVTFIAGVVQDGAFRAGILARSTDAGPVSCAGG